MKQVLVRRGEIVVEEVPRPTPAANSVLVKVQYSLISTGTEMVAIDATSRTMTDRILKKPALITKGIKAIGEKGVAKAIRMATGSDLLGTPLGYSASGLVAEVGAEVDWLAEGDRVACAGAGLANHAEFVCVPRHLVARIPEPVTLKDASTVTLGAIALQGIRQAEPRLGETVIVAGLGLLGILTVQMLKANGCRVIGLETNPDRCELAKSLGADICFDARDESLEQNILSLTGGMGADLTIITAATASDAPLNQAMHLTRKRGTVVMVGAVGMALERQPFYEKEIDLKISCSYGPGRYDPVYETEGRDYPYAFVRWTENRNMSAYLDLVAAGKINLSPLTETEYGIGDAPAAYDTLKNNNNRILAAVLSCGELTEKSPPSKRLIKLVTRRTATTGKAGVGIIGAGAFARGVHLPNILKLSDNLYLKGVASNDGVKAKETAAKFGASIATTDYKEILADSGIDMVLISTRHDSHTRIAIDALKAGKAVFLEKPMALNETELRELTAVIDETGLPFTAGFNRRFSPFAVKIREAIKKRTSPLMIDYQMNAGFLEPEHWIHGKLGGGRNIGEACHIYDLFTYLTGSRIRKVTASSVRPDGPPYGRTDNFVATLLFEDGSVCNLVYTAIGSTDYSKEVMKVYLDRAVIVLDDYKSMDSYGIATVDKLRLRQSDKGHLELLRRFAHMVTTGGEPPIPHWQLTQATRISFEVDQQIRR